jgi:hypothetical protein
MTYPLSRIIALIGLLCTMGLVWIWSQRAAPVQVKTPVSATEHRFDMAALSPASKNPLALDEVMKRPLFNPDRKVFVPAPPPQPIETPPPIQVIEVAPPPPPEPPAPVEPEVFPVEPPVLLTEPAQPSVRSEPTPPPQPEQPPPRIEDAGLQLKGISISGNGKRALLVSPQEAAGKWLKPGELMSGWEVSKIENNQVFLRLGKTVAKLQLYVDKPAN